MRKILLCIGFLNLAFYLNAQVYEPIPLVDNQKKIARYLNSKSKGLKDEFNNYSVKNGKIIKGFLKNRKELIDELSSDKYMIIDRELDTYLNGILQEIAQNNGIDGQSLKVFLSRDTSPNAFSLGEGSFVFNISLLSRLDNEEQLRFIMAHEFAHYVLDHLGNEMKVRMTYSLSDEYKEKMKKIKSSRFNRFSRSIEEFKDFQYGNHQERRKRELEADSLGFELLKNHLKNPANTILALQKLDSVSPAEIVKLDLDHLKKHFSTLTMPFNEEWTEGYDFSKYNYQTGKTNIFGIHIDSLRTHPEMEERISHLKSMMDEKSFEDSKPDSRFEELKRKFIYEDVYAHFVLEEYGRGIYLILQLQQMEGEEGEEDLFYAKMLAEFYGKLAESRRSFEFKKYVDDINYKYFTEEYRLFLTILENLRTSELDELSQKFKTK